MTIYRATGTVFLYPHPIMAQAFSTYIIIIHIPQYHFIDPDQDSERLPNVDLCQEYI